MYKKVIESLRIEALPSCLCIKKTFFEIKIIAISYKLLLALHLMF